jgi:hypothetical protein
MVDIYSVVVTYATDTTNTTGDPNTATSTTYDTGNYTNGGGNGNWYTAPYTSTPTYYFPVLPQNPQEMTLKDNEGNEVRLSGGKIEIVLKDGRKISIPEDIDKLNEKVDKLERSVKDLQDAMEGGISDEQSNIDKVPEQP